MGIEGVQEVQARRRKYSQRSKPRIDSLQDQWRKTLRVDFYQVLSVLCFAYKIQY
jgi:hypothetical protein